MNESEGRMSELEERMREKAKRDEREKIRRLLQINEKIILL